LSRQNGVSIGNARTRVRDSCKFLYFLGRVVRACVDTTRACQDAAENGANACQERSKRLLSLPQFDEEWGKVVFEENARVHVHATHEVAILPGFCDRVPITNAYVRGHYRYWQWNNNHKTYWNDWSPLSSPRARNTVGTTFIVY